MYEFEKVTIETISVRMVWRDYISKFHIFNRVRKDIMKCEFCDKLFMMDEPIHLAITYNTTNKIICTPCADKALKSGAESYKRKE